MASIPPRKKQRLSLDGEDAQVKPETEVAVQATADGTKPDVKDAEKDAQQRRSLFVRALPSTTTSESLTELFSESFPIKHATVVTDKETKECKGYGFVTFADAEDCQRAKEKFNGHKIGGRKLRCEVAEPRQRDKDTGAIVSVVRKEKEERERVKAENSLPPKLIVRNLPWTIKGPNQLTKLFQSYGKVKWAVVPMKKPGLLSGFGFVTMRGRKNAENALAGVNGKEVDGRVLAVDWAVERDVWHNKDGADGEKDDEEAQSDDKMDVDDAAPSAKDDEEANEHLIDDDDEEDGDEESGSEDEDQDAEDAMDTMDGGEKQHNRNDNSSTLFIRNLPFTCGDEDLEDHFDQFGSVRYARIVIDRNTQRPRGTGFVCFYDHEDYETCLKEAPRHQPPRPTDGKPKDPSSSHMVKSILQNDDSDPTGRYTMDGRVLQVTSAVNQNEANRLTQEGAASRFKRDTDKRRLYLLHEGTIATNTSAWEELAPSEQTMREASVKQRKSLIESNPSLHLSLTRLSVRNIPRTIDSKDLKALAREAIVGFATDVKEGRRQPLSKEELARGGEEMQKAERDRRARAKGVVKQAKIVFEGKEGSKVEEKSGAGRSRGYGFIEFHTHRSALMALRWLNGHAVGYTAREKEGKGKKLSKEVLAERKKRLIVEFAIENAQVVQRRKETEEKARERRFHEKKDGENGDGPTNRRDGKFDKNSKFDKFDKNDKNDKKRKRGSRDADEDKAKKPEVTPEDEDKLAKRARIIQRKRMSRRARKA